MDENKTVPTQDELNACNSIQDKFKLKPPELFYELNERGISKLFPEITHPYFLYNVTRKQWMYYNGKYWEEDIGGIRIQHEMKIFSFELSKYAINKMGMANEEFLDFVQSMGGAAKRKTLIKDAIDYNFVSEEDFDKNIYLFNCQNGTFDLQSNKFFPQKERLKYPDVLAALLKKCIDGFNEFIRAGLSEPQAVIDATAQYQSRGRFYKCSLTANYIKSREPLFHWQHFILYILHGVWKMDLYR